jgi:hypothetical protein
MALIAEDQPAQMRARLAVDEKARKDFAQEVRRCSLLLKRRSERRGQSPDMKRQLEFQKASVIAQYYFEKQGENGRRYHDAEVDEFFKQPAISRSLIRSSPTRRAKIRSLPPGDSTRAAKHAQAALGRIYIAEKKAIDQGMDKKPEVRLQMMLQHARAWRRSTRRQVAGQDEGDVTRSNAYLASHPELDTDKKNRAKAEEVLKRARAGEDFRQTRAGVFN